MSRSGSRFRRLLAIVAIGTLGFALLVVHAPDVLPTEVRQVVNEIEGIDRRGVLLFVGLVVAIVGLFSLWLWRVEERSGRLAERDPERPGREATVVGQDLTTTFERKRAGEGLDVTLEDGPLKEALRDVLLDVYDRELGSNERAKRHVDEGHWTTDRYAAAFLTTTDAVDYPLYFRLFAWLYPENAYEYRSMRALREVEDVCAAELSMYEAPDRSSGWRTRLRSLAHSDGGGGE